MVPLPIQGCLIPENEFAGAMKLPIFEIAIIRISLLINEHSVAVCQTRLELALEETPVSFSSADAMGVDVFVQLTLILIF